MLGETGRVLLGRVEIGLGRELQSRRQLPLAEERVERQAIIFPSRERPSCEMGCSERGGRQVGRSERVDGRAENIGDDLGDVRIGRRTADEDDVTGSVLLRGGRQACSLRQHCRVRAAKQGDARVDSSTTRASTLSDTKLSTR